MNSRAVSVLSLLLLLCFVTQSALAQRKAIVKRIDNWEDALQVEPGKVSLPPVSCITGNSNPGSFSIENWLLPPEDYYLIFDPTQGCGVCPTGFQVTEIRFLVSVAAGDSCELDVQASFAEAEETTPGCYNVTQEHCVAATYTAVLPGSSQTEGYTIGLPLDCVCADKSYLYAIGIHLVDARCRLGGVPGIVTDNQPTACTSWDFAGGQDIDLVTDPVAQFPGNLVFRASAECCEPYVGTDGKSWGMIKSLFQQ